MVECSSCCVSFCWGRVTVNFTHTFQGYLTDTGNHIKNPSWVPMWNAVHPSEFVFQKSRATASDFCGIQTHKGELHSTWAPWSILFLPQCFFPVITSQKHQKSLSNHRKLWSKAEVTAESGRKYRSLVPMKQPRMTWVNKSRKSTKNNDITTTKHSTTKPCAYFMGYTLSNSG